MLLGRTKHVIQLEALYSQTFKVKCSALPNLLQSKSHGSLSSVNIDVKDNGVAIVFLNRPNVRNALNTHLASELLEVFEGIKDRSIKPKGNSSIKALVLTGYGKSFCAGADLKERHGMTNEQWESQHRVFQKCCRSFQSLPIPTNPVFPRRVPQQSV